MENFLLHLPQALIVLGLILLGIEVLVFGLSTFVLLFVGIGSILTGILMYVGLLPPTLLNSLLATAILSLIAAVISWKPMKRIQNNVVLNQVENGMIGDQFELNEDLEIGQAINHKYSGIDWQVKAQESISAGSTVKIIKMDVGILTVERIK